MTTEERAFQILLAGIDSGQIKIDTVVWNPIKSARQIDECFVVAKLFEEGVKNEKLYNGK